MLAGMKLAHGLERLAARLLMDISTVQEPIRPFFWNLRSMHAGENVIVIDTRGKSWTFRITRIAFYTPQQAPLQEIFGNEAGHYLNLITCAGDWIPSQHQTTLRLVVFTSLVS